MLEHEGIITGINSGLGKYLFGNMNFYGFSRETDIKSTKQNKFKTIIHCAYNKDRDINSNNLYDYMYDNLLLTHELLNIPHDKFIYISTVDVYPKKGQLCKEDDIIKIKDVDGIYGITKLMSEQIVINNCKNHLILRPTALLGPYIKPNSLVKMLNRKNEKLNLSINSKLNYVHHKDVLMFINYALRNDTTGIFNLASKTNISLSKICIEFNIPDVSFGNYFYDIGNIDNSKIVKIMPEFNKTSIKVVEDFIQEQT